MDCLSKRTIKLLKNIKNENKKKNYLSILNNNFFINIYQNMKKVKKIKKSKILFSKIVNEKSNTYFDNNPFTSKIIYNKIMNLPNCYIFYFENNKIVYFTSKNINTVPNVIYHMMTLIIMLKKILKRENIYQEVIYFEIFEKKKFPYKNIILGPNEVNSGFTSLDSGKIILYRKEEVLKVLIHELIHSNLIDYKLIFSKESNKINDYFCINYKILLNEAFTETIATIIHLFYVNIVCKYKKSDLNAMFFYEILYSNYICNKIMKFYNIKNIKDILKKHNCKSIFLQKTNVFSYYFLKNILLKKHLEFGKLMQEKMTDKTINKIIDLIMYNLPDNTYDTSNIYINNKNLYLCLYELNY